MDARLFGASRCVTLENEAWSVVVAEDRPVILAIGRRGSAAELIGDPRGRGPVITLFDLNAGATWTPAEADVSYSCGPAWDRSNADFEALVTYQGQPAVYFLLSLGLWDKDVLCMLQDVVEHPGWQLMHVHLPRVVSAHTLQPDARMVIGTGSGRLVDPARCAEGSYYHKYGWIRDSFSTVGLVYNRSLTAVLQLESLDDTLTSSVETDTYGRSAGLGVELRYRYPASDPDAQFAPSDHTTFRIRLIDRDTGSPERGWVVGARYLQESVRSRPCDLYRDTFIYKVFLGCPGAPNEASFASTLELIRRIHNLTDGGRQLAYLVGFQHQGHDTGYPDVFTENETAGGRQALLDLMAQAATLNATVSFHDNYDDAYESSPAWDPEDISRDREGGLLRGGVWNGEQAYWISMPVYARTKAPERIRRTLDRYPIKRTYHLDVLTASVFRVDYRLGDPSGKDADRAARLAIVEEFRKHGIDVTSEGCGLRFLESISYFWHLPRPKEAVYAGDHPIPFGPFIAHGHVGYGGSHPDDGTSILDALLYGAFYSDDLKDTTPLEEILDAYYLLYMPLNLLRDERMVDYAQDGTRKRVTYSEGSSVTVDFESLEHEVCVRGRAVLRDFVSFAPGTREGTYLLYRAERGGTPSWPLPAEWKGVTKLTAVALTPGGDGESHEVEVTDGEVTFDLPSAVPFRVTVG